MKNGDFVTHIHDYSNGAYVILYQYKVRSQYEFLYKCYCLSETRIAGYEFHKGFLRHAKTR